MIKLPDEKKPYTVDGQRVTHEEYVKTKYEDLRVRVPKGKKEIVSTHAQAHSESVNGFINRAIDETMERDNAASGAAGEATEGK